MNLLEIINEYLRLKSIPGNQADDWLDGMAHSNDWPKANEFSVGMVDHIKSCYIDFDKLAIEEAKHILCQYSVNPLVFEYSAKKSGFSGNTFNVFDVTCKQSDGYNFEATCSFNKDGSFNNAYWGLTVLPVED